MYILSPAGQFPAANAMLVNEVSKLAAAATATTPASIILRNQTRCSLILETPSFDRPNHEASSVSATTRDDD
jgi:hypothetical protein